ncbi:MAG: hypothetical protein RI957_1087 [Verrucomicrobiota bacterium]|jgi:hypothetical protein
MKTQRDAHQQKWIRHFEKNRLHRPEPDWNAPFRMEEKKRRALAWSLAEYQLGDGGGPCRLIARDAENYRLSTPQTQLVTDHWFREEAEHSRLLSGAVKRLRGTFVTDTFAFRQFQRVRRFMGAQFEMLVLLQVEIISTVYYRIIRKHCGDEPIAAMCGLILRDETGHVSYHRDRLCQDHPSGWNLGQRLWFYFLGYACAAVLWLGHGRALRTIGMRDGDFIVQVHRGLRSFVRSVQRRTAVNARVLTPHITDPKPVPAN